MPTIIVHDRHAFDDEYRAFIQKTGRAEMCVEGPPPFVGMQSVGHSYTVNQDFADFLKARGFAFREA